MRRGAFTLIELMISIALLTIIVLFLTDTTVMLKKGYNSLSTSEEKNQDRYKITQLLYYDLLQATKISIEPTRYFDTIHLQTSNSLYAKEDPFVTYTVVKKNNTLIRLESDNNISLPIDFNDIYNYEFLEVATEVVELKITSQTTESNASSDKLLFSMFFQNKDPIIFELGLINSVNINRLDMTN